MKRRSNAIKLRKKPTRKDKRINHLRWLIDYWRKHSPSTSALSVRMVSQDDDRKD